MQTMYNVWWTHCRCIDTMRISQIMDSKIRFHNILRTNSTTVYCKSERCSLGPIFNHIIIRSEVILVQLKKKQRSPLQHAEISCKLFDQLLENNPSIQFSPADREFIKGLIHKPKVGIFWKIIKGIHANINVKELLLI